MAAEAANPACDAAPHEVEGVRAAVLRSVGASALAALALALLLAGAPRRTHLAVLETKPDAREGPRVLVLLVAAGAVAAARWLSRRADVSWQSQQLRVQWRSEAPAFAGAAARPGRRRGPDAALAAAADWAAASAASDAWRRALPDADVAAEVEALAARVVDDVRTPKQIMLAPYPLTHPTAISAVRDGAVVPQHHVRRAVPRRRAPAAVRARRRRRSPRARPQPRRAAHPRRSRRVRRAAGALPPSQRQASLPRTPLSKAIIIIMEN